MRRTMVAATLAAGVFLAAGCGDGGGDGGSTEEVCEQLQTTVEPLEPELTEALQNAALAAGQGDQAALDEASTELDRVVGDITGAVREGANDAENEEFRAALENFALELEAFASQVQGGSFADPASFGSAREEVFGFCG